MRRWVCVPMILLCLLTGCGAEEEDVRDPYRTMEGCSMEAEVSCEQEGSLWEAVLRCDYVPDGESSIEVLAPETIAGVRAALDGKSWQLNYQNTCLNVGTLSAQRISPAACLPRLMSALREGWLLEENRETRNEVPCTRLTLDQTGSGEGKILSTLWLKTEDGTPLRGEIEVDGKIILTAEFTQFSFCGTMNPQDYP